MLADSGRLKLCFPQILAEQHYQGLKRLIGGLSGEKPIEVALLTSDTSRLERRRLTEMLAEGELHILVGTHALQSVSFQRLGLAVIDEEHK